jgi:hypothetical protein
MLDKTFNDVVRYILAVTPREVEEVVEHLPENVRNELHHALDQEGKVRRYDEDSCQAYYLSREGSGLSIWIWSEIRSHQEAGRLLALLVNPPEPLNEGRANELYAHATGRSVNQLHFDP